MACLQELPGVLLWEIQFFLKKCTTAWLSFAKYIWITHTDTVSTSSTAVQHQSTKTLIPLEEVMHLAANPIREYAQEEKQ